MLDRIIALRMDDVEQRKLTVPLSELEDCIATRRTPLSFTASLKKIGVQVIAEVKRASPSRGVLRNDLNPTELAMAYAEGGAAAVSVLTEERHFQGDIRHLSEIRQAVDIPLLRKDFICDPYQIYEARAHGADAVLLIAAVLDGGQLAELMSLSHDLGLGCLVETHNPAEVERALASGARVIGINNRDLTTFKVDLGTTGRLRPMIPPDRVVVSESGIHSKADLERLDEWMVDAVLVGEALVTAHDVPAKMRELLS